MEIHFTARRFHAHPDLKEYAVEVVKKLDRYYDDIRRCDIILSYHRSTNSIKTAEINLHVNRTILTARENSEDFFKSIDLALDKVERRLETYKSKLRAKDKKKLRRARAKTV
jgi:putative sigma-54 modulation protein